MAGKPEIKRNEDGYLPMPLILCKTTRPHSFTKQGTPTLLERIKLMLAGLKRR